MGRVITCERCGTHRWEHIDDCEVCDSLEIQNFREALTIVKSLQPKSIEDQVNVARLEQIFTNAIETFEESLDRMYEASQSYSYNPSEPIDF